MRASLYRNYLLTLLMLILAFNFVDRLALGLVLQEIKNDLNLTDTQLGLLSGIAFALFYAVMGIPIARWADRGNRVTIITITTALWSAAVALCGAAANLTQLLLVRIAVAVGEAGCVPPAHSLIPEYFSRAERPKAVSIYLAGACLSNVIGYFLAGWLNQLYGWRIMFVCLGLPGLILAGLAWFTLQEPRRGYSRALATVTPPALHKVFVVLWRNVTFRHLMLSFSISCFFGYGMAQWQPSFFVRSYGMGTAELGTWFTLIYGLGGLLGTYWGGAWASRRAAGNERLQLEVMTLVSCIYAVLCALIYVSREPHWAFAWMAFTAVGNALTSGPLFAMIQTLVPERMRAMSVALIYLFANLIGLGLGPLATGALSDALRPAYGEESLRYALLALCPGLLWGAWHLWRASRSVTRALENQDEDHETRHP